MKFKYKNVLVYVMSISGEWVSKLLLKLKANVFLYDDDRQKLKCKNIENCYLVQELNDNLISQFDFIVVSPAIEKDNKYLLSAKAQNIKIFSEIEFASQFCKDYVALTGTNGKTTTVELISAMLNKRYRAIACGNIGYPLSRAVLEKKKYIKVVEVSSFMLENADTFSPHVASVLNIEADHINRHKTMEEYTKLKYSIFKNIKPQDYIVVNLDGNVHPTKKCFVLTYSQKCMADAYLRNGYIYLHQNKIIAINELKIKGKHNLDNVMCAICFAYIYKISPSKIREALLNFSSEPFRIEEIGIINGIRFINDSKSTNISSTLACVESIKGSMILLLGGSKKGLDYKKLFSKLPKRVKSIVVYGEIADTLIEANENCFEIKKASDLRSAFDLAVAEAMKNDNIVLSPATASYDQFSNYVERGKLFNMLVREYEVGTKKK